MTSIPERIEVPTDWSDIKVSEFGERSTLELRAALPATVSTTDILQ